jgi:hypothetical protein
MNEEFKEVFKILAGILALVVIVVFIMITCSNNNGLSLTVKPRMLKAYDESGKMIFQQQIPDGVKIKSVVVE